MSCFLDQTSNLVMFFTLAVKSHLKKLQHTFLFSKIDKRISACYQNVKNNIYIPCLTESFKHRLFLEQCKNSV